MDYLSAPTPPAGWADGIITNPPYGLAQEFAAKAIREIPYVALLVRTNFLMDGEERGHWLDRNPPTRTYYLLPRLPMMHRHGWDGPRSTSNTPHAGSSGKPEGRLRCPGAPTGGICSTAEALPAKRPDGIHR
jgi:hypothetical protein